MSLLSKFLSNNNAYLIQLAAKKTKKNNDLSSLKALLIEMKEVMDSPDVTWKNKHAIIFNEDINSLLTVFNRPIYYNSYGIDYQSNVTTYINILDSLIKNIDHDQTINNLP